MGSAVGRAGRVFRRTRLRLGPWEEKTKQKRGDLRAEKGESASEAGGAERRWGGGEQRDSGALLLSEGEALCTCARDGAQVDGSGPREEVAVVSGGNPGLKFRLWGRVSMERAGEAAAAVVVEECGGFFVFPRVRPAVLRSCLLQVCRWRSL